MMRPVLFTHAYFLFFDPKQWQLNQPYAPLGTLYAASLIRSKGYEVHFFDNMFSRSADDINKTLDTLNPSWLIIYDDGFNYLTKMCLTNMREAAFQIIQAAKARGIKVAVSSSDSTDHYTSYLHEGADVVLLGEAEYSLLEWLDHDNNNLHTPENIKGVAYTVNGDIKVNPRREVIRQLDDLPLPAWDLLNFTPYRNAWIKHYGYFSVNLGTTRGCPFKCNWCAKPIYGNRYHSRSPQNVINEIKLLQTLTPFEHIWFTDDIFGLKPGWVKQFSELVTRNNLRFRFKIQSRVDLLLDDNQIAYLAKAGCDNVWVGAESGSQHILDAMDKGTTVEQIYKATALLKSHHIKPSFFLQFGYPGETYDDILKTIKMVNDLLPEDIGISISYPLPGTAFYEKVKHELKHKANWTDSDDLDLMFQNTYSPTFYKQLHRFVHKNYRKHQSQYLLKKIFTQPASLSLQTLRRVAALAYYFPAAAREKTKLKKLLHAKSTGSL